MPNCMLVLLLWLLRFDDYVELDTELDVELDVETSQLDCIVAKTLMQPKTPSHTQCMHALKSCAAQ